MTGKTPPKVQTVPEKPVSGSPAEEGFAEIVTLIEQARQRAYETVNTQLIDLYWKVGETISAKLATAAWGEGVVDQLARYLARTQPGLKGFSRQNLFRMKLFYETYRHDEKLSTLVRQLPWTHNLIIQGQCKRPEEREFYLRLAIRERWGKRELERQLRSALFERTVLNPPQVSPPVRQMHPAAVEYPLSCSRSLAPIAEYQPLLSYKKLFRAKLRVLYPLPESTAASAGEQAVGGDTP